MRLSDSQQHEARAPESQGSPLPSLVSDANLLDPLMGPLRIALRAKIEQLLRENLAAAIQDLAKNLEGNGLSALLASGGPTPEPTPSEPLQLPGVDASPDPQLIALAPLKKASLPALFEKRADPEIKPSCVPETLPYIPEDAELALEPLSEAPGDAARAAELARPEESTTPPGDDVSLSTRSRRATPDSASRTRRHSVAALQPEPSTPEASDKESLPTVGEALAPVDAAVQTAEVHLAKAEEARRGGDNEQAVRICNRAIDAAPKHAPAYWKRAQALHSLGRCNEALEDLTKACALAPNEARGFARRGKVLVELGRHGEAIADFTRAVEIEPHRAVYYLNRAQAHGRQNSLNKLIDDCNEVLRLDPQLTQAFLLRGSALRKNLRLDEAVNDLDKVLARHPDDLHALNEHALIYVARKQYAEAIRDYNRALRLNPKLLPVRFNRGLAFALRGDHAYAIADFTAVIRMKPGYGFAFVSRAKSYVAQRDFVRAMADLVRAQDLVPHHPELPRLLEEAEQLRSGQAPEPKAEPAPASSPESHDTDTFDPSAPSVAMACPNCGSPGKVRWDRLGRILKCKGCEQYYRIDSGGRLSKVEARSRVHRRWLTLPSSRRTAVAVAVLLLAVSIPWFFMSRSSRAGGKFWPRFSANQLAALLQNDPTQLAELQGKDIEISGRVHSVNVQSNPPVFILRDPKGTSVVCNIDPTALSSRKKIQNFQPGKYVSVKGRLEGSKDGIFRIEQARIGMVFRFN
ncbi:MAG TPA: tetratricopeptide repeat protein [Gemmataceae bacterium]|nr:tetratricopeptide repeat protein [Gemmataceae bacterium]